MKIEIYRDNRDLPEWRWRVRARNGQIVIPPEGYKNKSDMLDTIESIRDELPDAEIVEVES